MSLASGYHEQVLDPRRYYSMLHIYISSILLNFNREVQKLVRQSAAVIVRHRSKFQNLFKSKNTIESHRLFDSIDETTLLNSKVHIQFSLGPPLSLYSASHRPLIFLYPLSAVLFPPTPWQILYAQLDRGSM